jgi:hypothetical protein
MKIESEWGECDNCGAEYFNTKQKSDEGFELWCKKCRDKLIQEKSKEIERTSKLIDEIRTRVSQMEKKQAGGGYDFTTEDIRKIFIKYEKEVSK